MAKTQLLAQFSKQAMNMTNLHLALAKASGLLMLVIGCYILIDAETMGTDQKKKANIVAYIAIVVGALYVLWAIVAWMMSGSRK